MRHWAALVGINGAPRRTLYPVLILHPCAPLPTTSQQVNLPCLFLALCLFSMTSCLSDFWVFQVLSKGVYYEPLLQNEFINISAMNDWWECPGWNKFTYLFFQVAEAIKENQTFNTGSQGHLQLHDDDDERRFNMTLNIYLFISFHISVFHRDFFLWYKIACKLSFFSCSHILKPTMTSVYPVAGGRSQKNILLLYVIKENGMLVDTTISGLCWNQRLVFFPFCTTVLLLSRLHYLT